MKPVNAKIPAKKKAEIIAMVALPKLFPSDTRRKTRQQFVSKASRFSGVFGWSKTEKRRS
jgi:hypothetical protein